MRIDLPDGRAIWFMDPHRPYWVHCNPARDLTDAELMEFGLTENAQ